MSTEHYTAAPAANLRPVRPYQPTQLALDRAVAAKLYYRLERVRSYTTENAFKDAFVSAVGAAIYAARGRRP
jgi:hypothetical protein